ncbi:hypothetical protein D3C81_999490 [compost metagenome]
MQHGAHVVGADVVLPGQPGVGAGGAVEADRPARAGADQNPAREVGVVGGGLAGGVDQVDQIAVDGRGHMDRADLAAGGEDRFLRDRRGQRGRLGFQRALFLGAQQAQDFGFVLGLRVVDQHLHQEAVHLRFRQRVGAFLLDGVLRRQHEEQLGHPVAVPGHGDLAFLHGLQQRRLDLGRGAVDLVGEDQVAEQRAGLEMDLLVAVDLLEDLGAGDVRGQQVGGELDAAHVGVQMPRQGLHGAGLGQAGEALQQQVTVRQQAEDDLPHHVALAEHGGIDAALKFEDLLATAHRRLLVGCSVVVGMASLPCKDGKL